MRRYDHHLIWATALLVCASAGCKNTDGQPAGGALNGSTANNMAQMPAGMAAGNGQPEAPSGAVTMGQAGEGSEPPPAPGTMMEMQGAAGGDAMMVEPGPDGAMEPEGEMGPSMEMTEMPGEMMDPPAPEDYGEGDGSDVVTIGDSWMSYALNGGGIEGALDRAGTDYRHYGVAGTTLAGSIPGQYSSAKRGGAEIMTVIMTGGGNDIMFSGACNTSAGCEAAVMEIVERLDELWTTMADDGVKDVVYIRYADGAGTTPDSTRPTEAPPPPSICLTGRIRCHSVDTTDLVMGSLVDGIHPTRSANDRIAAALIELMEAEGMRR